MLKTQTFKGANVFMSRNLVPPEVFDALLDALKLNGAQVFLCCDPSRSGPDDFHIISSADHEKFEDLRAKGCNLLGPQCVLSCAKEHKALPKKGFTCCLAMDGVRVLVSGFETSEKVEIEKMVTSMGGQLLTKSTLDVSFVVVKNVLAAKYKRAVNILKKPVVSINWLYQCWTEHRVVPLDPYKILPFSGLVISVTRIPADERKEIEKVITQNGGKYSAELTKACTHLICDAPVGDKFKVARRWGHIHIVTRKWFQQSVARKSCLDEDSYPVQNGSVASNKTIKTFSVVQHSQEKAPVNSSSVQTSVAAESFLPSHPSAGVPDLDLEATLSQNMSSMFSDPPVLMKELHDEQPMAQPSNEIRLDDCVADDSQSEDDLYLSECKISIVGFEACELRKLVNIVRRGGGSRYVSFNDKLTHIVVGAPTEVEKKELRCLAASGVIHVVRPTWLEDCDRERKEVPVARHHIAYDLLIPKDSVVSNRGVAAGTYGTHQGKVSSIKSSSQPDKFLGSESSGDGMVSSLNKNGEVKSQINMSGSAGVRQSQQNLFSDYDQRKDGKKMQHISSHQNQKVLDVFKGKRFCFSDSFPKDRRDDIIDWISQGGGEIVEDHTSQNAHFIIECHGVVPKSTNVSKATVVSSHWVRSCLKDEGLLDVFGHIIYSPLPCQIPLPGFENFRFCFSQHEEKEKLLLGNLCFVLGAKFGEKITRKVTHLICKFAAGPKYEFACQRGICSVTSEWLYECVRQNKVVAVDGFRPKEVTSQNQGVVGSYMFSQATGMISGDPSQFVSQSQDLRSSVAQTSSRRTNNFAEEAQKPIDCSKKARLLETADNLVSQFRSRRINTYAEQAQKPIDCSKKARLLETPEEKVLLCSGVSLDNQIGSRKSFGDTNSKDNIEFSHSVPDVGPADNSKKAKLIGNGERKELYSSGDFSDNPIGNSKDNSESSGGVSDLGPIDYSKKAKLLETRDMKALLSSEICLDNPMGNAKSAGDNNSKDNAVSTHSSPDVAAEIEDFLELTNEIPENRSLVNAEPDKNLYPSDPIIAQEHGRSHSVIDYNNWQNRTGKREELPKSSEDIKTATYDGFSETQTDSQVVVYEEDLSGRQMLIDRVRTRSSLT